MTEDTVYIKPDPKNELLQQAVELYKTHFGKPLPQVAVYAPGKITILGDHTEYLGGYTLNMSLPLYTLAVGAANNDHIVKVVDFDVNTKETRKTEFPIPAMTPMKKGTPEWANLIKAAVASFSGVILEGFNVVFLTEIPRGYGLGSSSSFVICAYTFLESITKEWTREPLLKAKLCAKAEAEYTGCTDPFADSIPITMGQPDTAFFIDCSKKTTSTVNICLDRYAFVVALVSMKGKTRELIEKRKKECEQAMMIINVKSLGEMEANHLKLFKEELSAVEDVTMRIRHALAEHIRVRKAVETIKEKDYLYLGRLMNQSHISARYDFEISSDDLNSFVDHTLAVSGVLGSRTSGSSLGNTALSLIRRQSLNEILAMLRKKFDVQTIFIQAEPCCGTGDISSKLYNLERKRKQVAVGVYTQIEYGVEQFKLNFGSKSVPSTAAYAPGRISVLGDHCDSNNSCVLQMAVPMGSTVLGALNNTNKVNIVVEQDVCGNEPNRATFILPAVAALESDDESWTNLFRAVIRSFHGTISQGFDCIAVCSLPPISGLGRTTSIIVAFYTFLECLMKDYLKSWSCKAKRCFLAQEMAESNSSTIADHLTIITSCEGCLTHVNTWNMDVKCQQFPVKEYTFLLCDSDLERTGDGLLFPGYSNQCAELQEILGPLRQLTKEKLKEGMQDGRISSGMLKRGTHVMQEITRVFEGLRAIKMKDIQALGLLMLQSHNSLIRNFELSSWEQQQLVAIAMAQTGVVGSKMSGSDASSVTLTLVKRANVNEVVSGIRCNFDGYVMIYEIDPQEGVQDVTSILQRELSKRAETLELFEVELSEDTLETQDLDQLSWPMFDLDNEWQVWEKKKKQPTSERFYEKSQESLRVVEEVLSRESEDEDEELTETARIDRMELRKSEMEAKWLDSLQENISEVSGLHTDSENQLSNVSSAVEKQAE